MSLKSFKVVKSGGNMFIGQYKCNLDEKNRLVIPLEYRKQLGTTVYLKKGYDKAISLCSEDTFNAQMEKMKSLEMNQRDLRLYVRHNTTSSFKRDFDSQGRIVIDEKLREYSGISQEKKNCVIVGVNDIIEIWSQELWDKYEQESEADFPLISEKITF